VTTLGPGCGGKAAVFVKRAGIREQLLAGGAIGGRHDEGRGVTLKE
jgi:hypothetical protein